MAQSQLRIDEEGLIAFCQKIIRTPSPSTQEELVACMVAERMREAGFDEVTIDPIFNVVGYLFGDQPEPELLFNGHIDHVPPSDIPNPYSGNVADGTKYGSHGPVIDGRGACDNKGAVASMIYAAEAIRKSGIHIRKTFVMAAVAREEMARGEGILRVLEQGRTMAKMALSGEATNLQVHLGHRGKLEFNIRVEGRTAHASNPSRGINAIYKMCDFIRDLRDGYRMPTHPVLGCCTCAVIDILSGPGRLGPITPDWCEIALDRRYLPEESATSVQKGIEELIDRRINLDPEFRARVELVKDFPPFYCSNEEPIVSIVREARRKVLGSLGETSVWKFGIDGTFIHRAGIPCVGFGPGDERFAHTPEDHVPVGDLIASSKVYAEIIRQACCE